MFRALIYQVIYQIIIVKSILNKLIKISFFTGPFYLLLILFSLEIFSQENYEVLDRVVAVVEKDVITLSELKIEEELKAKLLEYINR